MSPNFFSTFILILLVGILHAYSSFRHHFSRADEMKELVKQLQEDVQRERLRSALTLHQLDDFQQSVATLLPEAMHDKKDRNRDYQLRNLASIVSPFLQQELQVERASSIFEKGRKIFSENLFEDSGKVFEEIIEKYPESIHAVEAHFLLLESRYQMKEYESCIEIVENMMQKYPEHVLTGFAMLRLGRIFELNDRIEDAVDVYKTIRQSYADPKLLQQAETSLNAVAL